MSTDATAPPPSARPKRLRLVVGLVVVIVVAWLAYVGLQLVQAADETRAGVDELESLQELASGDLQTFVKSVGDEGDAVTDGSAAASLRSAETEFDAANSRISSPVMAPLRFVPVVGRQMRSLDALSSAAVVVTGSTADAIDALSDEAERPGDTPAQRLETTQRTAVIIESLSDQLDDLDLGPSEALVAQLSEARAEFETQYLELTATVDDAALAVRGVSDFLEGPTDYLVLAMNNSEMRAGSGMPLQVGALHVEQGEMRLGDFESTAEMGLPAPGATVDPDIEQLWGWLLPAQEWRNLNPSPRFDETARMASEMWASMGRGQVDGVMSVDVIGLRNLLEVAGPVQVAGSAEDPPTEVSADSVVTDLLLGQYADYVDDDVDSGEVTDARRERLGRVASAVFDTVNTGAFSATELVDVLQRSGTGRHVMMWSSDPVQQAGWVAMGASGTLSEDSLMLSILSRGANKLDQFLAVDARITSTTVDELRRVTVTVSLANSTPEGLPTYVAGPARDSLAEGDHNGVVALTMPGGAGTPQIEGAPVFAVGQDGPTRVIAGEVTVPRGGTAEVTITFDLPVSWTTVEVLPSARVPPVEWTAGDQTWSDTQPRTIELDEAS